MMNNYENIIEGILYLSGNEGVTLAEIELVLDIDTSTALNLIENLKEKYAKAGGLNLINTTNSYKLVTKSEYYDFFKKYANLNNETKLGNTTLEVLAIIAYKQPITKFEVEEIKGTNCTYSIQQLLSKNLIYVSGQRKELGRPNLYSTSEQFLDYIGLNELEELPDLKKFTINPENNSLLNFEEFDFKKLSEELLNSENTLEVKALDEDVLDEIEEVQNIEVDKDLFKNEVKEEE